VIDVILNADAMYIPSTAVTSLVLADAICLSFSRANAQFLRRMRPQTDRQKGLTVL
jgi:hypothetical protein